MGEGERASDNVDENDGEIPFEHYLSVMAIAKLVILDTIITSSDTYSG